MADSDRLIRQWKILGVFSGLSVCIIYPLLITVSMPTVLQVTLAAAFGALLIVASIALYNILGAETKPISLQLAPIFNTLAGAAGATMLIVQLAIADRWDSLKGRTENPADIAIIDWSGKMVWSVNLGQDVAWDVFIAIGTFLFAWNMRGDRRFGRILGYSGMIVALCLLIFNLLTFPTPPGDGGLIDLGPFVGFWYLLVTVAMWRTLRTAN